jgi:AAA ATPase domain
LLQAGDHVRLRLRGQRGTYEVAGVVERLEAAVLELRLPDDRIIRVPLDAVVETKVCNGTQSGRSGPVAAKVVSDPSLLEREAEWCGFIRQRALGHGRNVSVESLEAVGDYISRLIRSEEDSAIRNILGQIARGFELIRNQWLEFTYDRRTVNHSEVKHALGRAAESCRNAQLDQLEAVLADLLKICEADLEAFQRQATAHVHLLNALAGETHHVQPDRTFELTVGVSTDPSDPPIEAVQILVRANNDVQTGGISKGPRRLTGGQRGEFSIPLLASASAIAAGAATFAMQVKYRRHDGAERQIPQERITVLLQPAQEFSKIPNPYARFSGGAVVDDDHMFFGREELVSRMLSVITQGSSGQCFVLYGQKRTGKSSVLRQMAKRLPPPFLPVPLSVGQTDTADADVSFIQQCIDAVYIVLVRDFAIHDLTDAGWPNEDRIAARPLESFRRAFFAATTRLSRVRGWKNSRLVLLIDEFTYMYEYIVEGKVDASFMRQWKALLETGLFSAVIVGQDSMSKFKLAFPNEFGVTHDERISYLTLEDAHRFAEEPISLADGSSRFRGFALDRLVDLTAGNPFFQMVFCDRLVRHLNQVRSSHIVEGTVDRVLDLLCSGETALPLDRFDSLITAAGESVSLAPREEYLTLLFKIATCEGSSSGIDIAELTLDDNELKLLHDLVLREIVARDAKGRIRIRVALFAEWLRRNADGNWTVP